MLYNMFKTSVVEHVIIFLSFADGVAKKEPNITFIYSCANFFPFINYVLALISVTVLVLVAVPSA